MSALNFSELRKQMMSDRKKEGENNEDFVKKIEYLNSRNLFNLLQIPVLEIQIIDTRSSNDWETSTVRKSMNIPPMKSKKLKIDAEVLVDVKVDAIVIFGYKKEASEFLKEKKKKKKNFLSLVLSKVSKMQTAAKHVYLYKSGFQEFKNQYPFLCVSLSDKKSSVLDANDNYPVEILKRALYLGNSTHANDFEMLKKLNIEGVVNASDYKIPFPKGIECLELRFEQDLLIDEAIEFISAMHKEKKRVLVFCFNGQNKSAALVIGYMMKRTKDLKKVLTSIRGLKAIEACKPTIKPNKIYLNELARYQIDLKFNQEGQRLEKRKKMKEMQKSLMKGNYPNDKKTNDKKYDISMFTEEEDNIDEDL